MRWQQWYNCNVMASNLTYTTPPRPPRPKWTHIIIPRPPMIWLQNYLLVVICLAPCTNTMSIIPSRYRCSDGFYMVKPVKRYRMKYYIRRKQCEYESIHHQRNNWQLKCNKIKAQLVLFGGRVEFARDSYWKQYSTIQDHFDITYLYI